MVITNFTIDGNCSNCGACCSDTPCVTKDETRRIAKWLKSHEAKIDRPLKITNLVKATCPFRNEKDKRCEVYPVRPLICRTFKCDMGDKGAEKNLKRMIGRKDASFLVSLRWIFLGDSSVCKALGLPLVDRADWLGENPEEEKKR